MKPLFSIALFLLTTLFAIPGHSASFECDKAMLDVEKTICSDVDLSKLDESLGVAYRTANKNTTASTQLKRDQRLWLGIRNDCRDHTCIKTAYKTRIDELHAIRPRLSASVEQGNTGKEQTVPVCTFVARMTNLGKLEKVVQKGRPWNDPTFPSPSDLGSYGVNFRDKLDINNDGRLEYVYLTSEGSARFEGLAAYDTNLQRIEYTTSPEDDWESNNLGGASDRRIIRYQGLYYVIGKSDDYLNYVSKIGADNVEKILCEFGQKQNPWTRVTLSKVKPICNAAMEGNLDYISFDKLHAVTFQDLQRAGITQTGVGEKAAKIDIDNNGSEDYVVTTGLLSGAGRGCDSSGLALLNESRTMLADSPVAKLLIETGGACGGARVLPFRFNEKTYLEHKYAQRHPANVHSVFKIENGKRDVICNFEVRVVNYVLSQYEALVRTAETSYKNPWEYAFERSDMKQVKLLIKSGRDVNESLGSLSLLSWAVVNHHDDVVELLLKSGADPNNENDSLSPLWNAISGGTDESVALLIRYGAKLNLGNSDAITEAVRYGHFNKLKIILKAGIRAEQSHLDEARRAQQVNPEIIHLLETALSR